MKGKKLVSQGLLPELSKPTMDVIKVHIGHIHAHTTFLRQLMCRLTPEVMGIMRIGLGQHKND